MRSMLFPSKKTSATSVEIKNSENAEALKTILSLDLPTLLPEFEYDCMDVFTAASLSSEIIQRYLEPPNKNEVNAMNFHGWTPLMYAAYLGHKEVSQLLLSRHADPEACNENGQTAIMLAASCGSVASIGVLLKHSAKINQQDKFGRSSLHYAIKYNQAKITEILLGRGADPNLPDQEGFTPTLMACQVGNEATVAMLLNYKGNPQWRNKRGEQGISLALSHPKVLELLKPEKIGSMSLDLDGNVGIEKVMQQLELDKYSPLLLQHQIHCLRQLSELTEQDLHRIGITLFGPKKKILHMVGQFKAVNPPPSAGNNGTAADICSSSQVKPVEKADSLLADLQKQLKQSTNLCMAQQKEMRSQQELNTQLRRALVQICKAACPACATSKARLESLISRIDEMSMNLGSFLASVPNVQRF